MKGIILCAGKGTRLRPLTFTSPKHLLPIGNKPVLFYSIEALRDAGAREIGLVVGPNKDEFVEAVGAGEAWDVKISYIDQIEPLGLAHAVKVSRNFLGDDDFIMYLGDNLIKGGIREFASAFQRNRPNALILLTEVRNPSAFGVAELEGSKVIRVVEKPKEPVSNLAVVGAYMFDKNVHDAIDTLKPSWRGELEITDAIQKLIDQGFRVEPHIITGWWKDTGNPLDVLEANRLVLEDVEVDIQGIVDPKSSISGRVKIGAGSKILNSRIRGPVIIGENAKIKNAFIGPFTSVSDGVTITNSEMENSVLMANCSVQDVDGRIDDSIIGRNAEITRTLEKPKVCKFVLGDNSKVELT